MGGPGDGSARVSEPDIVLDTDITVTMRGVSDPVGLPYTVNPLELIDREALVEIREGAPGAPGPVGAASWPWQWMGDIADFAALQGLGLGHAEARRAWRVVDEEALYFWTGESWIRFVDAFGAPGKRGPANALTGSAIAGAPGSSADATLTGAAPAQHLEITIPRGETGDEGPAGEAGAIADAADVGDLTNARQDSVLAWRVAPGEFQPTPAPRLIGPWAMGGGQFASGSNLSASPHVIATMTIPAQPIAWRPVILSGQLTMQMHVASLNQSRVDLEVRIGAIDGPMIGYGFGLSATNHWSVILFPRYEYPINPAVETDLGVLQPNQTGSLYVVARRVTGSRNYTISNAGGYLLVMGQPLREQPS